MLAGNGPAAYVEAQALFLYPPDWIAANIEQLQIDDRKHVAGFPPTDNLLRRKWTRWPPLPLETSCRTTPPGRPGWNGHLPRPF